MTLAQITVAASQLEKQRTGYQAISLTNFDNDSEPQIAQGSPVEIGGALFEASSDENITGWAGIGLNTDAYIKLVVAGDTATAEYTITPPTWDDAKQGWYNGLDRYIGGLHKDGSGNYSYKWLYEEKPQQKSGLAVDVGMIAAFPFKNKPGWVWCDGSMISSTANPEYARLVYLLKKEAGVDAAHPFYHADADKAILPDIRGAVVRGIDAAANRDKDGVRKAGNYQADGNKPHTHGYESYVRETSTDYANNRVADPGRYAENYKRSRTTGSSGTTEATMKNVALYYLIKY